MLFVPCKYIEKYWSRFTAFLSSFVLSLLKYSWLYGLDLQIDLKQGYRCFFVVKW